MNSPQDTVERIDIPTAPDVRIAAWCSGGVDAPRVMFVHGFPEGAFVWHEVIRLLGAGVRCLAPSLRGFAPSSMPAALAAYRPKRLVGDLLTCIDHLAGPGRPIDLLVAHDWGGALAWNLAALHPERLRRLLIINSPHPATFLRELRDNPAQQQASEYMWRLVAPEAEAELARDDFAALWPFLGRAPWLSSELREMYRAQWAAGLTGQLNFYRASPLRPPRPGDDEVRRLVLPRELTHVRVPTTVLWGDRDKALLPSLLDGLHEFVPQLDVQRVAEASHWLVHERPGLVVATVRRLIAA